MIKALQKGLLKYWHANVKLESDVVTSNGSLIPLHCPLSNTPIPLGGDSATLQIFGQIAMDRSRIANSATEA